MIPQDKFMRLSYVNTKLRDEYKSLEDFCNDLDLDQKEIEESLGEIGYSYDKELNKFC